MLKLSPPFAGFNGPSLGRRSAITWTWKERRAWVEQQAALPRKAQVLLRHLADFANDGGKCWPDQDKLVARTAWAKGTIKRWTDFLRSLDLVATKKRFNRRKGYCDAMEYTLNRD